MQQFGTVNKCLTVHEDSENDGTSNAQERGTGDLKEPSSCAVTVDSSLSKSFLCSLYNSEIGNETFKQKVRHLTVCMHLDMGNESSFLFRRMSTSTTIVLLKKSILLVG